MAIRWLRGLVDYKAGIKIDAFEVSAEGYERVADDELAERFETLLEAERVSRGTTAPAGGQIGGDS